MSDDVDRATCAVPAVGITRVVSIPAVVVFIEVFGDGVTSVPRAF